MALFTIRSFVSVPADLRQWTQFLSTVRIDGLYSGKGSPEGVITGIVGSLYTRTDGGAGTTLYVKESGTAKVGWVAK